MNKEVQLQANPISIWAITDKAQRLKPIQSHQSKLKLIQPALHQKHGLILPNQTKEDKGGVCIDRKVIWKELNNSYEGNTKERRILKSIWKQSNEKDHIQEKAGVIQCIMYHHEQPIKTECFLIAYFIYTMEVLLRVSHIKGPLPSLSFHIHNAQANNPTL